MKPLLVLAAAVLGLAGCTHSLHVAHYSDFSPTFAAFQKGEWVEAEGEQFTFMGFVTQTNYVNTALNNLVNQCPNGNIQGIQTQYSTDHGFFSWTNRVRMQGLCVKRQAQARR
ncbi:MAG: hypothetical protein HC902_12260 [Calothrix sp. SM1_5_4]|nr:hypothetical protein [Calothrix sp. SM1_5_4]